ncbi:MAG: DUF4954 family protein [Chitinophagaceae bacterium]
MQNDIKKISVHELGYNFINKEYIPEGKTEYYLRDIQNRSGIDYRKLTAFEIELLVRNRNTSDDWNNILVGDAFNPELVRNCKFYGLIRIGKLEPFCLVFSDLKLPVGLYNSTIISCDIGDNVVVENVHYLSHYILGNEVILSNVNEMITTNHSKFGNGIVKQGENESIRIWLELCNENGGRKVMPFVSMQPADAYLWSKYRDDEKLLNQFRKFTEEEYKNHRGYYGKIGDRTVIKNTEIIKDVWIGSDAYIKGANKLKNITINSGKEGKTQIGEGVELVNGIVGYGCRVFYGAKGVRFVMAAHSQLKYGARLINSYLGHNSTISCCEVLNALIFPFHEQHHNNSFLCAALIKGQSNMAAGATVGSNHNSRGADGEIIAGRGFWPGLCVSLKHNSKFASFVIIAKGDYSNEIDVPLPFTLVANNDGDNSLTIMPAYWFMYNMYALARNSFKYASRDNRKEKKQIFETNYLAPDTINEIVDALAFLEYYAGYTWYSQNSKNVTKQQIVKKGKDLLNANDEFCNQIKLPAGIIENSKRTVVIAKAAKAYHIYKQLINLYVAQNIVDAYLTATYKKPADFLANIPTSNNDINWENIGGQLMPSKAVANLKQRIVNNKISCWDQVHDYYQVKSETYKADVLQHAVNVFCKFNKLKNLTSENLIEILQQALETKTWLTKSVYESREKDYTNPFRKMVYDTNEEMNMVLGKLEDNTFIVEEQERLKQFTSQVNLLIKLLYKA